MLSNSDSVQTSSSLYKLLEKQARQLPEEIALLNQHHSSLTYSQLYRHITQIGAQLNELGIGRNDRIAIVLPNGPEMAVAFLAIAASATAAPLNPNYRVPEFEFYLSDLDAKALVIQAGTGDAAREVAKTKDIPIIELAPTGGRAAGLFALTPCPSSSFRQMAEHQEGFAQSSDIALVLHTSGTTSRPKIVPLHHSNLLASAQNIAQTLALMSEDCCLNVMPLFHIHGLVGCLLSSLIAGASISCTSGFNAEEFLNWLRVCQPTWYSAVPTIHQSVLAQAQQQDMTDSSLRLIRSSSSAMPARVMADLESTFSVPVIEAYGMTEASHQMTANPLPPALRKPRSVGIPGQTKVAIAAMDSSELLSQGDIGEVVIQGKAVTHGYVNNSEANAKAFFDGWFRTGDQGYLDEDGYLFLQGRLKEIVNRGGEKVSPLEVDEVLMDVPEVHQAVSFAVPHPTLGEDLAAAVVLKANAQISPELLREHLFAYIAPFKVPSQIVVVDSIPKGATGKLQRIGLAEKLADQLTSKYVAPRNETEQAVVKVMQEILQCDRISIIENFFVLGGDSLKGTQVTLRLGEKYNIDLPNTSLFRYPTASELATEILRLITVDESAVQDVLAQLEGLPPEEIKRLLGN